MTEVVTCFLTHQGKVLILKRSQRVGSFRGRWAGVSGYIPEGVSPLDQAYTEMREETGLDKQDVELLKQGEPLLVVDESQREWLVHPFLFSAREPSLIKLDWEHTQARWIEPEAIPKFQTVPQLKEAWEQLWER